MLRCANPGPARGATGSGYARDQSTTLFEHEEPIAIDVSRVDAVNGALFGLLLRALCHGRMPIEAAQFSRVGSFL